MRPGDPVTFAEAARILGCSITSVRRRVAEGRLQGGAPYENHALSRTAVEVLALEVFAWWRHVHEPLTAGPLGAHRPVAVRRAPQRDADVPAVPVSC